MLVFIPSLTVWVSTQGGLCGKDGSSLRERGPRDLGNNRAAWPLPLSQVLGLSFFAAACLLYKHPLEAPNGLEASLPSQSSASDTPMDLQDAPSALQLQSDV